MAKSIKLKDSTYIDSTGVVHNRETLKSLLDKLVVPAYIKVKATQDQFRTTVGTLQVDFDTVVLNKGNAFQLYNNKVQIISDKVHHVRVDVTMWVERGNSSYAWCHLTKNGTNQLSYMLDKTATNTPWFSITMSTILDVTKNDYIYPDVYFNNASNDNGVRGGTYANSVVMSVEVID